MATFKLTRDYAALISGVPIVIESGSTLRLPVEALDKLVHLSTAVIPLDPIEMYREAQEKAHESARRHLEFRDRPDLTKSLRDAEASTQKTWDAQRRPIFSTEHLTTREGPHDLY